MRNWSLRILVLCLHQTQRAIFTRLLVHVSGTAVLGCVAETSLTIDTESSLGHYKLGEGATLRAGKSVILQFSPISRASARQRCRNETVRAAEWLALRRASSLQKPRIPKSCALKCQCVKLLTLKKLRNDLVHWYAGPATPELSCER
jgi:hypothetical protein